MTVSEAVAKAVAELREIIPKVLAEDRAELAAHGLDGIALERTMVAHEIACYERALSTMLAGMREMMLADGPVEYPFTTGEGQAKH